MEHVSKQQIRLLLTGGMKPEQEAMIMEHIVNCDECAALLYDTTAAMPLVAAPVDSPNQIRRELKQYLAGPGDSLWRYSLRVAISVCAALVLLFSGSFGDLSQIDFSQTLDKSNQLTQEISDSMRSIHENILSWRYSDE